MLRERTETTRRTASISLSCVTLLLTMTTMAVQASELEDRLGRAERLADLTNGFAVRCENDITREKTADTEDCDNFLATHGLWFKADKAFQDRHQGNFPQDEAWREANHYRLEAYQLLINKTRKTTRKVMEMIREIP